MRTRLQNQVQDKQNAVEWYRKAAEQGYAESQFLLGQLYLRGLPLPPEKRLRRTYPREAYAWFSVVAARKELQAEAYFEEALSNLRSLEDDLSPETLAKAKELATEYGEKYGVP